MTSAEIKNAMQSLTPIEYNGHAYARIQAYIYRVIVNPHTGKYKAIFQVELYDNRSRSVTVASPDKVELHEKDEQKWI